MRTWPFSQPQSKLHPHGFTFMNITIRWCDLLFTNTSGMSLTMKTSDIEKLSKEEKLELMEAIWANLSKTEVSAPAWHEQALKETEDRVAKGLEQPVDWKDAKNQLRSRFA